MPDHKDALTNYASKAKPKATQKTQKKRPAPDRSATREEASRRGKPTVWRLHPNTKPAIDRMARQYEVGRGDLVDFLIRAGMRLVADGRIELPRKENETPGIAYYAIEAQPIPDEFRE